jgi:hypothetical protein
MYSTRLYLRAAPSGAEVALPKLAEVTDPNRAFCTVPNVPVGGFRTVTTQSVVSEHNDPVGAIRETLL